jgi:acetyl esterase/lipase
MTPDIEIRPGISVRARVTARLVRLLLLPFMRRWPFTPRWIRALRFFDRLASLPRPPRGTNVRRVRFDGFVADWIRGAGVENGDAAILYFHGGGFIGCGLGTHRRLATWISAAAGLPVLSVGYRQLPDCGVNGSVADCVTAYRRLLDRGYEPSRIIVAGDSAGGYLAFATPLRALSEGLPAPAGIVALSPLTDLDHTAKLAHANSRLDPYIPVSRLPLLCELWQDGPDPLVCPVDSDLTQLPPTLIQARSSEALLCDAELMAARLAAAGVPCRLQIWERQLHVFQAYSQVIPEGFRAIAEIGSFIRARVAPGAPAQAA